MNRGMYREMYHGALYHGILSAENTVVRLYRSTFVPCCIHWYTMVLKSTMKMYHVTLTMYHGTFSYGYLNSRYVVIFSVTITQFACDNVTSYRNRNVAVNLFFDPGNETFVSQIKTKWPQRSDISIRKLLMKLRACHISITI